MKGASFDIRFLDYVDGTMSSEEEQKFLRDLAENEDLRKAFDEYQQLISMEARLRKELKPCPALLDRIMAEMDEKPHVVSFWSSCMDWMSKKRIAGGLATVVVVCLCIVIVEDWPDGRTYNGLPVVPVPMVGNREVSTQPDAAIIKDEQRAAAGGPVAVDPVDGGVNREEQVAGGSKAPGGTDQQPKWAYFEEMVDPEKVDSSKSEPLKMSAEEFDRYLKELAGDPSKVRPVEPHADAPPAFKAMQACLQSGDYECANQYVSKYVEANAVTAQMGGRTRMLTEDKLRQEGLLSKGEFEEKAGSPKSLSQSDIPAKDMRQNQMRDHLGVITEGSRGLGRIISSDHVGGRDEPCVLYNEDGTAATGACHMSDKGREDVFEHTVPLTSHNMVANALEDTYLADQTMGTVLTTPVGNAIAAFNFANPAAGQILSTTTYYGQTDAVLCRQTHNQYLADLLSGPGGDAEAKAYLGCIRKYIDTTLGRGPKGPPCQAIVACQADDYLSHEPKALIFETPRILTQTEALSTFSIDVDTGSYTNIRNIINHGTLPDPTAVRIEELINYFDYTYPNVDRKPFGVSYEIAPSPFNEGRHLLRIGLATTPTPRVRNWNLVFLVDVSGSMEGAMKLELIKRSLHDLAGKMKEGDTLAIVTYAQSSRVALEPTSVREMSKIRIAIDGLVAAGGTNGAEGIQTAYQLARANRKDGTVSRVILATDGDFNIGVTSDAELVQMIEEERESGVTLTTIGVGADNFKEPKMEQLADKGNGNYFYLDSDKEARRVFGERLMSTVEVVAKDVKLQIEFNPSHVVEYRLVGYDNRVIERVDFKNDKVDAGELGSGHTVTALYEVTLKNSPVAKQFKSEYRYKGTPSPEVTAPAVLPEEFAFLRIRFKQPDGDTSEELQFPFMAREIRDSFVQASNDFQFTTAVLGFGSLLRDSIFRGSARFEQIIEIAQANLGTDPNGQRREFVDLAKSAGAIKGSLREVVVSKPEPLPDNQFFSSFPGAE